MTTDWMPGAERIESAAFGGYDGLLAGAMQPIAVVNHIMQGYQSTMIEWARQRPASGETLDQAIAAGRVVPKSAHITIGRGGRVVQHVGVRDAAWHAGGINAPSWGPARSGTNPNRYTIGIEHEGFSVSPPYPFDYVYSAANPWPREMVEASIAVHRWLLGELGITAGPETVIGHNRIDSVTRAFDPGPQWPRERVIAALSGRSVAALPPPLSPADPRWPEIGLALYGMLGRGTRPLSYDGDWELHELRIAKA